MRKLTTALFLTLAVIAPSVSANTHSQGRPMALHLVQKIYVEDMGTSPEAARFRLLLEDQLSENGFVVVAKREEADAILSGVTSVSRSGFYGGPADISVTARLVSSDGDRLWSCARPHAFTKLPSTNITIPTSSLRSRLCALPLLQSI